MYSQILIIAIFQFFNSITFYLHSLLKFSAVLKNRTIFINPYMRSDSQFRSKVTRCEMMLFECASVFGWSIIDRFPGVFYIRVIWRSHSRFDSARRRIRSASIANVLRSQHHFISIKSNWHVAGVYLTKQFPWVL